MSIEEIIRKKIIDKRITIIHLEVKDFTGRHLNHDLHSGGFHLEATIVSDDFAGKGLIERHMMIYTALDELIQKEIHAISMKTLTSSEWKS